MSHGSANRVFAARTGVGVLLGLGLGCGTVMPFLSNWGAEKAPNPLVSGQALAWSHKPNDLPFEGASACSVWPIQDELKVTVSADQICVTGKLHRLWKTSVRAKITGELSKIGTCYDSAAKEDKGVWEASFANVCTANKGTGENPLVTATSTFLRVGPTKWKFPDQALATAAGDADGGATAAAK